MANKFLNIKLHLIFAAKGHDAYLKEKYLSEIFTYLAGSINKRGHHSIIVGGTSSHIHILFQYNPSDPISDLVRDLKSSSTVFINKNHYSPFKFLWQTGYACFSVSPRDTEMIKRYISRQKEHHSKISVRDELKDILTAMDIPFSDEYLFEE